MPGSLEDRVLKVREQIDILAQEARVLEEQAKQSSEAAIERARKARERLQRLLFFDQ